MRRTESIPKCRWSGASADPPAKHMKRLSGPLASIALVLAVVLAYGNALETPFIFDDLEAVRENPSIRTLRSWQIFAPPPHVSVSGRPLANASLALNYAWSGPDPRSYHVFNLVVHALAALTLFGLLRQTFAPIFVGPEDELGDRHETNEVPPLPRRATEAAFAAALLWALHPLQTEAVTYIVQRTESLMGLFYFLTLYAFVRGRFPLAVVACACGMATKEVMVTAPLVVLLYDRTFLAKSWSEIFARRGRFYAALAGTWIVLAVLVLKTGDRAGTAGLVGGATWWGYALGQVSALLHYLRLVVWPHPLVLDYGLYRPPEWSALVRPVLMLAVVSGVVIWAVRGRPRAAFAAIAFLLILAPTSSVLPIVTEPIAERRLYVSLAAVTAAVAIASAQLLGRRGVVAVIMAALAGGGLTFARNRDYAHERTLWEKNVAAVPDNPRAHYSLALTRVATNDPVAAERHFRAALALQPNYLGARHGYATLLTTLGRSAEAAAELNAILRVQPDDFVALCGLGNLAFARGELPTAIALFERAIRVQPDSADAHNNLGAVYYEAGDALAARRHEEIALRLRPDFAQAHYNLGNALGRLGLADAAQAAYLNALLFRPHYPEAHNNRGNLFSRAGRFAEAAQAYTRALELDPNYAEAHVNLASALERTGNRAGAIEHYRAALRLIPEHAYSRQHLEALLNPR